MLVEGASEVALEQLVIIHGLGDDTPHETEVAEMIRVTVRG